MSDQETKAINELKMQLRVALLEFWQWQDETLSRLADPKKFEDLKRRVEKSMNQVKEAIRELEAAREAGQKKE